jgi:hypothetical protein
VTILFSKPLKDTESPVLAETLKKAEIKEFTLEMPIKSKKFCLETNQPYLLKANL